MRIRPSRDDEVTQIDLTNPLLAAMAFMAALAYPESIEKRDRALNAMKAMMTRACRRLDFPAGETAEVSRLLAEFPVQQQRGTLSRLSMRLRQRMLMASVASDLIGGVRSARKVLVPPVVQKRNRDRLLAAGWSMAAACERTAKCWHEPGPLLTLNELAKRSRNSRFKQDVWRPEVLHLALVFRAVVIERRRSDHRHPVTALLANPDWAPRAMERAEMLALNLRRATNLPAALIGVKRRGLVRLVPSRTVEISQPAPE